jgi:hypothetical protein
VKVCSGSETVTHQTPTLCGAGVSAGGFVGGSEREGGLRIPGVHACTDTLAIH